MAGLKLNMGAFGSTGGGYAPAAVPAAAAQPTGPTTISQKGFGIVAGGSGGGMVGPIALVSTGTLALVGLIWIWYSLPR